MKKLLPIILTLVGIAAGIGAGIALRPDHQAELAENPCGDDPNMGASADHVDKQHQDIGESGEKEYVKLNNQFIVSVVSQGVVTSLVLISLSLEVETGRKETVFSYEPKLRDALLQVMLDHANIGGFEGAFTNSNNLDVLRFEMLETARNTLGSFVTDVLILDIARQDV